LLATQKPPDNMAAAEPVKAYTCNEDGVGDCPCHTAEKTRPPAAPKELSPLKVHVVAGSTSYFCACGASANFPYCDGSHKRVNEATGSNFAPIVYTATEDKDLYVCRCGHSKSRPFCDGSHRKVVERKE
jgi:CDGSH-type Zn-finger protein